MFEPRRVLADYVFVIGDCFPHPRQRQLWRPPACGRLDKYIRGKEMSLHSKQIRKEVYNHARELWTLSRCERL